MAGTIQFSNWTPYFLATGVLWLDGLVSCAVSNSFVGHSFPINQIITMSLIVIGFKKRLFSTNLLAKLLLDSVLLDNLLLDD